MSVIAIALFTISKAIQCVRSGIKNKFSYQSLTENVCFVVVFAIKFTLTGDNDAFRYKLQQEKCCLLAANSINSLVNE